MNDERRRYEHALTPARTRLAEGNFASKILSTSPTPDLLERFVIELCARSVGLLEPLEDWIESAGTQCILTGYADVGRALKRHANQVAGQPMLLIADTHALVARRKRRGISAYPAGILLGRPSTPATRRVIRLHEETIAGATPYGEIALAFELSRVWAVSGLALLTRCRELLGRDSVSCLTFLDEHTRPEAPSARFLANWLDELTSSRPETAPHLEAAGAAAVVVYSQFLDECLAGAMILSGKGSGTSPGSNEGGGKNDAPKSSRRMAPKDWDHVGRASS